MIKANKFLDSNSEEADIGSTRFHNTVQEAREREQEVSPFSRELPNRTGVPGCPAVRKKSKQKL